MSALCILPCAVQLVWSCLNELYYIKIPFFYNIIINSALEVFVYPASSSYILDTRVLLPETYTVSSENRIFLK